MDDSLLITKAITKNKIATKIQVTFYKIKAWIFENRMVFNQTKFEAIYFFQKSSFPNLKIVLLPNKAAGIGKELLSL